MQPHENHDGIVDANESKKLSNVEVDDDLVQKALDATGAATKREVVELALRTLILQMAAQEELLKMGGTAPWDGDLDAMRTDR